MNAFPCFYPPLCTAIAKSCCEPLLEPVDLSHALSTGQIEKVTAARRSRGLRHAYATCNRIESLRRQCMAHRCPFSLNRQARAFVKTADCTAYLVKTSMPRQKNPDFPFVPIAIQRNFCEISNAYICVCLESHCHPCYIFFRVMFYVL